MCEVIDRIKEKSHAQGLEQGEESMAKITRFLMVNGRLEDLERAASDRAYREQLKKELFPEG